MSLKTRLVLLFLAISIIPLFMATAAGYYHIIKVSRAAIDYTGVSLKKAGEALVEQKAVDIVRMIQYYLHPKMAGEGVDWKELQYDPLLLEIAIQTVGETGYSFLLMKEEDSIINFLHPNPKLIGAEIVQEDNPDFWHIAKGPEPGMRFSGGYYWEEPDVEIDRKFMAVASIPDTPFMAAVTIYVEEMEAPLEALEADLLLSQERFLWQFLSGGAATVLVVIVVAMFFAARTARPLLHLTEVAKKISLGELATPIKITSTDEIGDLADALRRMQASLRKAIQRLQKRRAVQ